MIDRTKLEQEQALSLRLFDTLLTSAPFGFAFFDRDLRFVRINEQLAEMNGHSVAAHLGKTVAEVLPALEGSLREVAARILATGQPVLDLEFTGETARAPGIVRHCNASWYPVLGERGEIIGFSAMVVDITERKQAEAALRHTNECFELAVKASKVVLFQLDLELRYLWIRNPLPGFVGAGIVGKRDVDVMERAEDAARAEALQREVIRSGVGQRLEVVLQIQNEVRHFDLLVEPMRDATGVISGVTCAAVDITERKRAEAAVLEREQHFQALAEASMEIPYRMSADWSTMLPLDGRGLFESSDSSLADWAWVDQYLPLDEQARVRKAISDAIARKSLFELEHRVLRADGSTGWVRSRAVPILDENEGLVTWFGAASDITERKQAQQALAERTELLNGVLESTTDVIFVSDLNGRVLLANAAFAAAARSTPEQLVGMTAEELFPPDLAAAIRKQNEAVIAGGSPMQFEETLPEAGEPRVFLTLKAPLRDGGGRVVGIFGISRDITERKQVEDRLRASEARLRRVFESNVVGMIRWDLDRSLILDANAEFLRMSGYVRDDITSGRLNFRNLTPTEWTARNEDGIRAIRANRHEPPYEKEYFHKDGSRLPLLIAGTPFEDSPSEGMSFLIDLTEMKQAEAKLRERTELLNGVLEGTTDVIFVKDLDGRCLMANTACAAVLSLTPEQMVGKTTEELCLPDLAAAIRQHDEAVIAGGSPIQFEETFLVAGETRVFLTLKAPLRDGNSRVIGILGISRDITERKRIELHLIEATAVAEKANRAKSDFLSNMSHELRTPLNAILGFAQLMESSTPPPTPAQSRSLAQVIKGGWYLLELVNELLDLAQIESGKLSLTQEPVSLAEVMLECQAMIQPQASKRAITMTFPSLVLPGYARADRTRVKQVVINLLSNAIKYNKARGAVTVEVALSSPDAVRVSVRDTGEGLAPEKLAQLFQPFNRLGQETGPEQGTGIGLVMSRRIIELMGGAIGAESTVGVGSVFWFELKWASA